MGGFLKAPFLYLFQEGNCCPVFLKLPGEMEGQLGNKEKVLDQKPGWLYPSLGLSNLSVQRGALDIPCSSPFPSLSISLIVRVVATVASCVPATFQAWAGLWASREGPVRIIRGPEVLLGKTHLPVSPASQPASQCLPSSIIVPGLGYAEITEQTSTGCLQGAPTSLSPAWTFLPSSRFLYFTDA